jgi:hypothetical protein
VGGRSNELTDRADRCGNEERAGNERADDGNCELLQIGDGDHFIHSLIVAPVDPAAMRKDIAGSMPSGENGWNPPMSAEDSHLERDRTEWFPNIRQDNWEIAPT